MNTAAQTIALREVMRLEKGKPPAQQDYYSSDAALYLTPEYLRGKGGGAEQVKPSANAVLVNDGETIVLWDGSNAGEIFRAKKGVLASTMTRISHGVEYDRDYFYYALKGWEEYLKGQTSGSGIPHVDKEVLGKLELFEFTKPEQPKIAEVLSTVDRAIEQTEALIAKQQRIKTGLMQDLLTKGIDEHGNLRNEATHEFKDSPLGRIPVEWDSSLIEPHVHVRNNMRKPIASLVREGMKGTYPYYGPTGILDWINEYRVDGRYVLIGEDGDHFLKYLTQEMTMLVEGKYNVNNHAHIFEGRNGVSTDWLHVYFMHRDITLHLTRQGAGRYKLNKAALLGLPLAFPKNSVEQELIVNSIYAVRKHQEESKLMLNKIRSQKTALMQDLLTGKKRVTPLLEMDTKD